MRVLLGRRSRLWWSILVSMSLLGLSFAAAYAQSSALRLSAHRDFGYGLGNRIQGSFTLSVSGPTDIASVTYYIDEQELGRVDSAPFSLGFSTGNYPQGAHTLRAEARTAGGQTLRSDAMQVELLGGAQAWQEVQRILFPLLAVVFGLIGVQVAISLRAGKQGEYKNLRGDYGPAGGAICPRCAKPYARHFSSPNLVVGKLERCPWCGKWAVVPRAPAAVLAAAEAAEEAGAQPTVAPESDEDRLRRQIEGSRYR